MLIYRMFTKLLSWMVPCARSDTKELAVSGQRCAVQSMIVDQIVVARRARPARRHAAALPGSTSSAIASGATGQVARPGIRCVVRMFEGLDRRGLAKPGGMTSSRPGPHCRPASRADPSLRGPRPGVRRRGDGGGSGWQAVQVDGIPPPPVGRADPIPDATGELDDPRLAGHPAQAEQFADRRGSPVRSHYHEAKCTTGKDDLPRRLHRGSRVSAVRTGRETHGRHGAQQAVTPAGDRRQRGSTVTCQCSPRCRAVAELRTVGPTSNSSPTNLNYNICVARSLRCPQSAMKYPQPC